jgi:hypothetical protein
VFLRLEKLQAKLVERQAELPPLVRPWFHHHDTSWGGAIGGARVERVFFPAEDETTGIVLIGTTHHKQMWPYTLQILFQTPGAVMLAP